MSILVFSESPCIHHKVKCSEMPLTLHTTYYTTSIILYYIAHKSLIL